SDSPRNKMHLCEKSIIFSFNHSPRVSQSIRLFPYTTLFRPRSGRPASAPRARPAPGRVAAARGCTRRGARGCEPRSHAPARAALDRKSTRLNSSHVSISYAVFCLKKKKNEAEQKKIEIRNIG